MVDCGMNIESYSVGLELKQVAKGQSIAGILLSEEESA